MSKWFVMVHAGTAADWPAPLVEDDGETIALFATERQAVTAADNNAMAQVYGYETYEWPWQGDGRRSQEWLL